MLSNEGGCGVPGLASGMGGAELIDDAILVGEVIAADRNRTTHGRSSLPCGHSTAYNIFIKLTNHAGYDIVKNC